MDAPGLADLDPGLRWVRTQEFGDVLRHLVTNTLGASPADRVHMLKVVNALWPPPLPLSEQLRRAGPDSIRVFPPLPSPPEGAGAPPGG